MLLKLNCGVVTPTTAGLSALIKLLILTCKYREEFKQVDESLDAVTDGIDHNDKDEDGCQEDIPSFSLGRAWKKEGFFADSPVDQVVDDDKEKERSNVDDNGYDSRHLNAYAKIMSNTSS